MSSISAPSSSGHGHDHPPFLAHHFENPAQQFDSAKLGMWLFLATEVLFFGGLFVAYAVLRARFPEVFSYSSHYLDTILGGVNTAVLIASSLTMALAVRFAQLGKKAAMLLCLWLTLGGAFGFLVIKYFEYTHKIHLHLVWGKTFYVPPHDAAGEAEAKALSTPLPAPTVSLVPVNPAPAAVPTLAKVPAVDAPAIKPASTGPAGLATLAQEARTEGLHEDHTAPKEHLPHLEDPKMPANTHVFFGIYYAMTGLHGVHVLVGIVVIVWLIIRGTRGEFGPEYYTPVDVGGLYWHIVDLVWIFLFPLFYLIH